MDSDNLKMIGGPGEYVLRTGAAPKIQEPQLLNVDGLISAPREFYEARKHLTRLVTGIGPMPFTPVEVPYFALVNTHVLFNLAKRKISLVTREKEYERECVTGTVYQSNEFSDFFASGSTFTPASLAKHLSKYRYLLADQGQGMRLISELRNFKASVSADVKQANDRRGNKENALVVSAESNVPLEFDVRMPLFMGEPPSRFKVEIYVEVLGGSSFELTLEAPDVPLVVDASILEIFDRELKPFKDAGFAVLSI